MRTTADCSLSPLFWVLATAAFAAPSQPGTGRYVAPATRSGGELSSDGLTLLHATRERDLRRIAPRVTGDGGGADVSELGAAQVLYLDSRCPDPGICSPPCNAVLMFWVERTENPAGVTVFYDGKLLGTVEGLPVPGVNSVLLTNTRAGAHEVRVEDPLGGTSSQLTVEVLDAQPVADPAELTCTPGDAGPGDTCKVLVRWSNAGTSPESYFVFIDDVFLGQVAGDVEELPLQGVGQGDHCVSLIALAQDGKYQSCAVQTCCTVTCKAPDCNHNGVDDRQDIATGTSEDRNADGIPDECKALFHRGDPNSSGVTDISDAITVFGFLFLGAPLAFDCRESADINNDAAIDISDGISLLQYLFNEGPRPAAPGPPPDPCGLDSDAQGSPGDLGCAAYEPCGEG